MEINRLAFGTLAAVCIAAAGGGAYLATRHNAVEPAAPVAFSAPADPTTVAGALGSTEASEGVVTPAAATTVPVATPAAPPARALTAPPRALAPAPSPRVARPAPAGPPSHDIAADTRTERDRSPAPQPAEPAPLPSAPAQAAGPPSVFNPPPPEPQFQELVVSADQVIGLQVDTPLVTSERARIEDRVDARVTRDVKVGDRVAIPAGAKALGSVTLVDRGGKMRDRARLGIRFHTIVLADGTRLPIQTDAVFREGDGPGGEAAAKVGGGAIGGAIIGGILGGARGAILGGTAGAGAGTAAVMTGGRNPATLHAGETVTVRLMQPVAVTVDKD